MPRQEPQIGRVLPEILCRAWVEAAGECSGLAAPCKNQCCVARMQLAQPSGSRLLTDIWMKGGYCQGGGDSGVDLLKEQLPILFSQAFVVVVAAV